MTIYYTSNDATIGFDVSTTGAVPTDWVTHTGTWAIGTVRPTSGHSQTFGSTTENDGDIALLTGITAEANMAVTSSQIINTTSSSVAFSSTGLIARADSGYANGYVCLIANSPAQLVLYKLVSGTYTTLGSSATLSFTDGDLLNLSLSAIGTTITATATTTTSPTGATVTVTDGSVSVAGYAGLWSALGYAGLTPEATAVDNFVVTDGSSTAAITVTTPGSEIAGNTMTVYGTYTGTAPTSLNYEFDSAGYTAAPSPSIFGGTYSFSVTAPSAGSHTVSVQESNATSVTATSGSFSTTGAIITINTPGTQSAGSPMTISGTYTGTAPTGLNYEFDSAGYTAAPSPTISGGNWSFTATAPAAGTHTVSVQEANATSITATSGNFTTISGTSIATNNAAILYSPYNWNVGSSEAITVNPGAYFFLMFTGNTCVLNFDISVMGSPAAQIWYWIDEGPIVQATVVASITCTIPALTNGNVNFSYHLLKVWVKSTSYTYNRWLPGTSPWGAIRLTSILLGASASVLLPVSYSKNILFYGDSITEGILTLGTAGTYDTDQDDATVGWAYEAGRRLSAEVGIVAFGGTGITVGGNGNVPELPTSYNLLYSGVSRTFSPLPDLIVFNEGTNDGANNTVANMITVLNGLLAACPGVPMAVMRPFNGYQAANLQAAIAGCNNPSLCHYIDTTGFLNTAYGIDSQNIHPTSANNLGQVASKVEAALAPFVGINKWWVHF